MNEFLARLPEFVANNPLLCLLFLGLVVLLIGTELMRLRRGFSELTPAALTHLINRADALLVDLSSSQEYAKGHIPGSRHVEISAFDPENKELAKVRERPVVVVCKTGTASGKAAKRLVKSGFTAVHTLAGGTDAWRRADLPLTTGSKK